MVKILSCIRLALLNFKPIGLSIAYCMVLYSAQISAQPFPKRELRAAWIATVANIDWPSKKGLTVHQQQYEYVTLLDSLKAAGMNAVIVQVRPVADALYPSSFEPWSEYLTGVQGKYPEPYYNPLTFLITEARKRGLEFHAWFNPYRAGMDVHFQFAEGHPVLKHPEWFLEYGGKWYYDPGNPEAQEFVLQSILETVKHYDLDAVHFDDYFYPYRIANVEFPDSCSYDAFGRGKYEVKDDWRRNNVDYFVEELSKRIKNEKPHVKFGISPFGVWRNKAKDPDGSETQAGQTNYDDLYADVLRWLREGWIDYITPQLYWHIGFKVADYTVLLDWWSRHTYGKHLYIGQGVYRLGGKGWESTDEVLNQIRLNRTNANVHGSMYFSAKSFLHNKNGINGLMRNKIYPSFAMIPEMEWIASEEPGAPSLEKVQGSFKEGVKLEWKDSTGNSAYYAVYRFDVEAQIDISDPARIVAIVQRTPYQLQQWQDKDIAKRSRYQYVVTALNRLHKESAASNPVSIRVKTRKIVVLE